MRILSTATAIAAAAALATPAAADFITKQSSHSVTDTMDALVAAVTEAGATVFARVDHSEGATSVGVDLADAQLLVFGNPALGTPALQDDLRAGLALPLRVLVYDNNGQTVVYYEEADELFDGLDIDDDAGYVTRMEGALNMLTDAAIAN